jgi:dihydroxyacetone kinase-like predicted kinase
MNPSTAELLAATDAVPAPEVVLLANNTNIIGVAQQVDVLSAKVVRTVPTVAVGQGLLALEAYDGAVDATTNARAMAEVAERVRSGCVTQAVRAASAAAIGPIEAGQWLGLVEGSGVVAAEADLEAAARAVVEQLLVDAEAGGPPPHRMLIFSGEGAAAPVTGALRSWLDEHHAGLQVEEHEGGQPLYPYLFTAT